MANLEPMPISSLPEGSIQDGDKMIIYRDSNGKAYQSDASSMESVAELKEEVDKLSADLTDLVTDISQTYNKTDLDTSTSDLQYSGYNITIPANSLLVINCELSWATGQPYEVALSTDESGKTLVADEEDPTGSGHPSFSYIGYPTKETTYYLFGRWGGTTRNCRAIISGCYIKSNI